ncbi:hypothetical protein [Salinibacterium sp. TMP30]|uniref:hypothetical protein n=1 Tax=Salinibacterium sp. TMP30 TaxID=3138237 RepID=UPI003139CB63
MATAIREKLDELYFLTPAETAELIELTVEDLRKMRAAGTGPRFVALTTRTVRYFTSSCRARSGLPEGKKRDQHEERGSL